MIGQGIMPESWSPLADNVPGEDIGPFLDSVAKSYCVKTKSLPTHRQFVASLVGDKVKEHQ
jgi:tryptophan halogenase